MLPELFLTCRSAPARGPFHLSFAVTEGRLALPVAHRSFCRSSPLCPASTYWRADRVRTCAQLFDTIRTNLQDVCLTFGLLYRQETRWQDLLDAFFEATMLLPLLSCAKDCKHFLPER